MSQQLHRYTSKGLSTEENSNLDSSTKSKSQTMTLIEDIFDLQIPDDVEISPNAQQVIYTTTLTAGIKKGEHALSTIWLAETGKSDSSRQLTSGLYNDESPTWSPRGDSIAFLSDRAKTGESSAIYILPTNTAGEAYPVTPADNEQAITCLSWSPRGDFLAYISADEKTAEKKAREKEKDDANVWNEDWEYGRLRLVHVATKKSTTPVSRNAHVAELAWNDDGTKIALAETKTPHIESQFTSGTTISMVDVSSNDIQRVCHFPSFVQNFTWAIDSLYFIGPVSTDNTVTADMVYKVDLTADSVTYAKCAHGQEDCAGSLQKAGKDTMVFVKSGVESQIRMLNGRSIFSKKQELDDWDAAFTTDSDEMVIAVVMGSSKAPPEVFTTTASGGSLVKLSNHGASMADYSFGVANFISCESASVTGETPVKLDGVFITPTESANADGTPKKALPLVVQPHGGPYGRNNDQWASLRYMWAALLLNAGYAILLTNYRGSSGRGEDFAAFCRGGCGMYDYSDVIELTQCAIEKGFADKDRLVMAGWSQGGFLSYLASTRNGQHKHGWSFKATIPGAGVSDGDTMSLTSDVGYLQADLAGKAPWECDKSDTSGRTGSALWEFATAAKKGTIPPMLILHGEKDVRVPIEQAAGFRRALEINGLPFEYVTYPRENHIFEERKHLVDMAERVLRFVDFHIGAK